MKYMLKRKWSLSVVVELLYSHVYVIDIASSHDTYMYPVMLFVEVLSSGEWVFKKYTIRTHQALHDWLELSWERMTPR